ncbi:MAG TPA: hypothetical protein VNZ57_00330, partial [Longimicrobiales bacterium]|nr:hypothetical protein [Longimicrobiales bacterium]
DSRTAVALYMLTAAGSIAVPWIATRNSPVSQAMADLSRHGATRGIIRGLMLEWLFRGDEVTHDDAPVVDTDTRDEQRVAAAAVTSVVESVLGYWWARAAGMDRGMAYSVGNGSDFGMLAGLAATGLIQPNDFDSNRLLPALVLLGAAGGAPIGAWAAQARGYSHGDAHVMRTTGLLGAGAGLMVADLLGADTERPIVAGATIGGLGGLILGDRLARPVDLAIGPARLVQLATAAGAAVGLGTAYLLSDDDWSDSPTAFLTLGTLGGGAAFALTYRAFARSAPAGSGERSNLRIDVFPTGTFGNATQGSTGGPRLGAAVNVRYLLP